MGQFGQKIGNDYQRNSIIPEVPNDNVTVRMASKGRCQECGRLVDCYLREVARHTALLGERAELRDDMDPGDLNWLIRQAEWRIREVRKEFSAHRANHLE